MQNLGPMYSKLLVYSPCNRAVCCSAFPRQPEHPTGCWSRATVYANVNANQTNLIFRLREFQHTVGVGDGSKFLLLTQSMQSAPGNRVPLSGTKTTTRSYGKLGEASTARFLRAINIKNQQRCIIKILKPVKKKKVREFHRVHC